MLETLLDPAEVRGRRVRLMFQDEARFGRMVRTRRCWAQKPMRPAVCNGYEREFLYVYAAVSPKQGQMDWMITSEMNTAKMTVYADTASVRAQLEAGLPRLAGNRQALRSLTAWP